MLKNNMKQRLKQTEGIIWDLDNTLYRFEGDFEHLCHVAAAKAALNAGVDMTHEEAFEICLESYDLHGNSSHLFVEKYRLDKQQMHYDFHRFINIDEKLIKKSVELIELFAKINLTHVLVTHASGEWAHRALTHLGLKEFFPDNKIIPLESTNFKNKSDSRVPFEMALGLLDLLPERAVVVEDMSANLRIPHDMGLGTVLVHYGKPPVPMPDYINMDCNNAIEFLNHL